MSQSTQETVKRPASPPLPGPIGSALLVTTHFPRRWRQSKCRTHVLHPEVGGEWWVLWGRSPSSLAHYAEVWQPPNAKVSGGDDHKGNP